MPVTREPPTTGVWVRSTLYALVRIGSPLLPSGPAAWLQAGQHSSAPSTAASSKCRHRKPALAVRCPRPSAVMQTPTIVEKRGDLAAVWPPDPTDDRALL